MYVRSKEIFQAFQWNKDGDGGVPGCGKRYERNASPCKTCGRHKKEHGGHGGWIHPGYWLVNTNGINTMAVGWDQYTPDTFALRFEVVDE